MYTQQTFLCGLNQIKEFSIDVAEGAIKVLTCFLSIIASSWRRSLSFNREKSMVNGAFFFAFTNAQISRSTMNAISVKQKRTNSLLSSLALSDFLLYIILSERHKKSNGRERKREGSVYVLFSLCFCFTSHMEGQVSIVNRARRYIVDNSWL